MRTDGRAPKSHRSMATATAAVAARSVYKDNVISSAARRHGLKRSTEEEEEVEVEVATTAAVQAHIPPRAWILYMEIGVSVCLIL